jgi:hypothetical protein
MQPYKNVSGESGIVAFERGDNYIDIEFNGGSRYRYDYRVPGRREVETMKRLAQRGEDLATFINKYIRERFAKKLR